MTSTTSTPGTDVPAGQVLRATDDGIAVVPFFATRGLHPYDELEWETRDAVTHDYRTGEESFRQEGVEFPADWSLNATTIVATKYFRGALDSPQRERSVKQMIDRVADTITDQGAANGYFASDEDAETFRLELKHLLVNQKAAFNSPVWFNIGVDGRPQQCSACFVLSVEDTMGSILNWYVEEGKIFQGGSGAGTNLSRIRGSNEGLSGGGHSSGPISFMRGADASAGTIASGGTTRRAAKMVILDADHPDIETFVATKAEQEDLALALKDAGYDPSMNGEQAHNVLFQNANNSVGASHDFMQAVVDDLDWDLVNRTDGTVARTIKARDLMDQIAKAAWRCADPGMFFLDQINDMHTTPGAGPIRSSNPCFPSSARVHTDKGQIPFGELLDRVMDGEAFQVYTHDATAGAAPRQGQPEEVLHLTSPSQFMVTGINPIVQLRFSNGQTLRCTPNHSIFTTNRGYVQAEDLTAEDMVRTCDLPTSAVNADWRLPVSNDPRDHQQGRAKLAGIDLPARWTVEMAHYMGWMVGDGSVTDTVMSAIYGTAADVEHILPLHEKFVQTLQGDAATPATQPNGTVQLRVFRQVIRAFFDKLGLSPRTGASKRVPHAIFQAPDEVRAAFLRGLFDADGTCVSQGNGTRYVGLSSISQELLEDVASLLTTFGIHSTTYQTREAGGRTFRYTTVAGEERVYEAVASYDLRITGPALRSYHADIGFELPPKRDRLEHIVSTFNVYDLDTTVTLVDVEEQAHELTFNLTEPRNHSYIVDGIVVRNCSEFVRPDNSSCNLASLNLLKFVAADGRFETDEFVAACEILITAMDILISFADFPTEAIGGMTRKYRDLGLGYSNLGALLMRSGLPYDSDEGRAYAGAVTALMTGAAYRQSSVVAEAVGPFAGYAGEEEAMAQVLATHAASVDDVARFEGNAHVLDAARAVWSDTQRRGAVHGYRNAQASLLAPTGCLDADTLVPTDRGLVRLGHLGDTAGDQWQDIDLQVATDQGARRATKFYVNGLADIAELRTSSGSRMRGTPQHRVKVVTGDGSWQWRHLSDVRPGDIVPVQLGGMVGEPQPVRLPDLEDAHWNADHTTIAPREMSADLAELVGLFMGDGSYHAKGLRFSCEATDLDTIGRIQELSKSLFHLQASVVEDSANCVSVTLSSTRLVEWWDACGFRKHTPSEGHFGKGYVPHIPSAVLHSNDPEVYGAFLRGVFTSDGTVHGGRPAVFTAHQSFLDDLKAMLLVLGLPTRLTINYSEWGGSECHKLTVVNSSYNDLFRETVGFSTGYKQSALSAGDNSQSQRYDLVPLTGDQLERILEASGVDSRERSEVRANWRSNDGGLNRRRTLGLAQAAADEQVMHLCGFYYDTVDSCELTGEQVETFDLSVPDNTTYVANGLISHNTISFLMDCDTTGIEPDLGLVKFKKLAGGSSMQIVNQSVPAALATLGYDDQTAARILEQVLETGSVLDTELDESHVEVFACAMGDVSLSPDGHMKMMAACQPFLSGAISKTVNLPNDATVEDIRDTYIRAWQMGIKCIAVYRDGCKNEQPLSVAGSKADAASAKNAAAPDACCEGDCAAAPQRTKLPRRRHSETTSFRVGEASGYITVGEYDDGTPGEVFLKLGKQGSTLSGLLDAFAIAMSIGLQYGVPLDAFVSKFLNMRFEPAGMTDDPDARISQSLVDYVARRMAFDYMPIDQRELIGLKTTAERAAALDEAASGPDTAVEEAAEEPLAPALEEQSSRAVHTDAPLCLECGGLMVRAGSCFCCEQCGTTSGCS